MYGLVEGEPFKVFVRREPVGSGLVIRFECKEGMGVLGVRRPGRADPAPVAHYEEEGIDAAALRAGRFVHVLANGQRQSYALSRIGPEVSGRIPTDRWLELEPHTEYGFRYLVASEKDLDKVTATVAVGPPVGGRENAITQVAPPRAPGEVGGAPIPSLGLSAASMTPLGATPGTPLRYSSGDRAASVGDSSSGTLTAGLPPVVEPNVARLTKEQVVELLRAELAKVQQLQLRVAELEDTLRKSRVRERDLLELLTRWSS
jgi:hypothetical protein